MKITICHDDRVFEAYVESIGSSFAEVSFYEVVRPTWKIFRTKFLPFGSISFSVANCDNIISTIQHCFEKCLIIEQREKEIQAKWKELENESNKILTID